MGQDIIKDFVKKQTTAVTIGVPRQRPQSPVQEVRIEPEQEAIVEQTIEEKPVKGKVGRPKSDVERVKLSLYIPAEAKEKLIRIQHDNYKQNLNDILLEAVNDIIKKYS